MRGMGQPQYSINSTIRVGLVGYGYWGPHIARNLNQIEGFDFVAIVDQSPNRLSIAQEAYKDAACFRDAAEAIKIANLEAVVIATPANTHYQLARMFLQHGIHVVVEKPLTTSLLESRELAKLALENDRILMVDHTFVYTNAVKTLKTMVDQQELGDLVYFDSMRVNLGIFQPDVSVLWDLAVHDLAILDYVTNRNPVWVQGVGGKHKASKKEAAAYLTLSYADGFFAHINVSWLSPTKIRQLVLSGSKKTVIFNDLSQDEKIRVYDSSVEINERALLNYRLGDLHIPRIENTEALRSELLHFHECIQQEVEPLTSAQKSLGILSILDAAERSMNNEGKREYLRDE
jgi:predicted dehydrogenase